MYKPGRPRNWTCRPQKKSKKSHCDLARRSHVATGGPGPPACALGLTRTQCSHAVRPRDMSEPRARRVVWWCAPASLLSTKAEWFFGTTVLSEKTFCFFPRRYRRTTRTTRHEKRRCDRGASPEKHHDHPPSCVTSRDPTRMSGGWSYADHPPMQTQRSNMDVHREDRDFRYAAPNSYPHHPPCSLTREHATGNLAGGRLRDHPPGVFLRHEALIATTRHVRTSRRVVICGPPARTTRAGGRWSRPPAEKNNDVIGPHP
jgi:hypothetical protein